MTPIEPASKWNKASAKVAAVWLSVGALVAATILFAGYLIRRATGVRGSLLYRDANAIAEQPFYYGLLEYATASILMMSGAILAFETLKHRRDDQLRTRLALSALAILTMVLGADDLLMLHENAHYLRLSEKHVLLGEGMLLGLVVVLQPKEIMQPLTILAVMGLSILGLAVSEDALNLKPFGVGFEDYLEIVGFSFWCAYVLARASTR